MFSKVGLFLFYNILLLFHDVSSLLIFLKVVIMVYLRFSSALKIFPCFWIPFFFFYLSNSLGLYILCWGMSPNVCRPLAMSSYLRRIRHQNADWKFRVHNLPRQLVGFTTELIFLLSFLKENPTISCLESINMAANFTEQSGYVLWVINHYTLPPNLWAAGNYRPKPFWFNFSREHTYFLWVVGTCWIAWEGARNSIYNCFLYRFLTIVF